MPEAAPTVDPALPALTARSIVLSALLGVHPPSLRARDLVRVGELFGVGGTTLRAALSRMVSAGDLVRDGGSYVLASRLQARQERQDASLRPGLVAWESAFEVVVVTAGARAAADRAALRARLRQLRLGELREGVWLRPANLDRALPVDLAPLVRRLVAVPDDPPDLLVRDLWDLPGWSARGRALLGAERGASTPAERFVLAAAVLRYLLLDPVLPRRLQPPQWPADDLRGMYERLRADLVAATALTVRQA